MATGPSDASVAAYLEARGSAAQQADASRLIAMMERVVGAPPAMWGPSIVGFGSYTYPLAGNKTGTSCLAGFAIRGAKLVVYLQADAEGRDALLAQLGPHTMGKGCLYLKKLADVDEAVLEALVAGAVAELRRRHG